MITIENIKQDGTKESFTFRLKGFNIKLTDYVVYSEKEVLKRYSRISPEHSNVLLKEVPLTQSLIDLATKKILEKIKFKN